MQNISPIRYNDDDQNAFDDDVDALFEHLERFEPPVDMVERIMDAVTKLPPHQLFPQAPSGEDGTHMYRTGQ